MKWFQDLKILWKIVAGFVIAVLIASGGTASFGIINNSNLVRNYSQLYDQNGVGLKYVGEASENFLQLRYCVLKMTTLSDSSEMKNVLDSIKQYRTAVSDAINKSDEKITEATAQDILSNDIVKAWLDYSTNLDKYLDMMNKGSNKQANDMAINTLAPIDDNLRNSFLKLSQQISSAGDSKLMMISKQADNSIGYLLAISAAAYVIAVLIGVAISRSISAPINTVVKVLGLLAKGDMNFHRVLSEKDLGHNTRKDEVGILARATDSVAESINEQVHKIQSLADGDLSVEINIRSSEDVLGKGLSKMISQFNDVVSSIKTAANQVASGSGIVSHSSAALSQGATEQASAISQLTMSIEEVAAQTNRNAENAEKVDEISRNAKADAACGNAYMKDMLVAMDDINESSGKIKKIIKVIDDIAFQTNILALNAAVEAARAGVHGKGFAVVAEEVRTLAARSVDAVKETTDLIETSIRKVEAGTRIANDTAEELTKIVSEVDRVAELVSTITLATQEQAVGIKQINMGVSQVSQVVQTNAATAEESAATSEELSAQAEQLMQSVSIFKIRDNVIWELQKPRAVLQHSRQM